MKLHALLKFHKYYNAKVALKTPVNMLVNNFVNREQFLPNKDKKH